MSIGLLKPVQADGRGGQRKVKASGREMESWDAPVMPAATGRLRSLSSLCVLNLLE